MNVEITKKAPAAPPRREVRIHVDKSGSDWSWIAFILCVWLAVSADQHRPGKDQLAHAIVCRIGGPAFCDPVRP